MNEKLVGLGNKQANLYFYIKNRPPINTYQNLSTLRTLTTGEIAYIANETGNHWRKIFNVYAKLMFELRPENFLSWQTLRDEQLLQANQHCLLFSEPVIVGQEKNKIHIVLGKGYAQQLNLLEQCSWLNNDFAVNFKEKLIICPYFDYRQLSNIKITQLAALILRVSHDRGLSNEQPSDADVE